RRGRSGVRPGRSIRPFARDSEKPETDRTGSNDKESNSEGSMPRGSRAGADGSLGGASGPARLPEFCGQRRVAPFIRVEVNQGDNFAVLHFALAQVVQVGPPMAILGEIFRHAFREKNMSGVAAIHDALGDVDAGPGDVRPLIYVGHSVDRSAVNAHANLQFGVILQRLCNLKSETNGR